MQLSVIEMSKLVKITLCQNYALHKLFWWLEKSLCRYVACIQCAHGCLCSRTSCILSCHVVLWSWSDYKITEPVQRQDWTLEGKSYSDHFWSFQLHLILWWSKVCQNLNACWWTYHLETRAVFTIWKCKNVKINIVIKVTWFLGMQICSNI